MIETHTDHTEHAGLLIQATSFFKGAAHFDRGSTGPCLTSCILHGGGTVGDRRTGRRSATPHMTIGDMLWYRIDLDLDSHQGIICQSMCPSMAPLIAVE